MDEETKSLVTLPEPDSAPQDELFPDDEWEDIEKELEEARARGEAPGHFDDWEPEHQGIIASRRKEVARMAAIGLRNKDICLRLGYTPGRVSTILLDSRTQSMIAKFQDRVFDKELSSRIEEIAPDAMDVIEDAITSATTLKSRDRVDLAKWVMEKTTGKPTQTHELESGTLGRLLDKMDVMDEKRQVIDAKSRDIPKEDIQEAEIADADPIMDWVDAEFD